MAGDLTAAASRAMAERVREALARKRMSREALAHAAGISLSTLEKALAGSRPFTLSTLIRLEEALGVSLRADGAASPATAKAADHAPDHLGGYSRVAVAWMVGGYITLRPSFTDPQAVYAYRTEIAWDETKGNLTFQESERLDTAYTQAGDVALSVRTGMTQLIVNFHGEHRLVTLGRPAIDGVMYGLLNTLQVARGGQLTPIATTIAFLPLKGQPKPAFGAVGPAHPAFAAYRTHLRRISTEAFARVLG